MAAGTAKMAHGRSRHSRRSMYTRVQVDERCGPLEITATMASTVKPSTWNCVAAMYAATTTPTLAKKNVPSNRGETMNRFFVLMGETTAFYPLWPTLRSLLENHASPWIEREKTEAPVRAHQAVGQGPWPLHPRGQADRGGDREQAEDADAEI